MISGLVMGALGLAILGASPALAQGGLPAWMGPENAVAELGWPNRCFVEGGLVGGKEGAVFHSCRGGLAVAGTPLTRVEMASAELAELRAVSTLVVVPLREDVYAATHPGPPERYREPLGELGAVVTSGARPGLFVEVESGPADEVVFARFARPGPVGDQPLADGLCAYRVVVDPLGRPTDVVVLDCPEELKLPTLSALWASTYHSSEPLGKREPFPYEGLMTYSNGEGVPVYEGPEGTLLPIARPRVLHHAEVPVRKRPALPIPDALRGAAAWEETCVADFLLDHTGRVAELGITGCSEELAQVVSVSRNGWRFEEVAEEDWVSCRLPLTFKWTPEEPKGRRTGR